jgi:hypothetical protein
MHLQFHSMGMAAQWPTKSKSGREVPAFAFETHRSNMARETRKATRMRVMRFSFPWFKNKFLNNLKIMFTGFIVFHGDSPLDA